MNPFCGLGVGLSILFGFILLGIVADLYYFYWKKRIVVTAAHKTKPVSFCCSCCCFGFHAGGRKPESTKLQPSLFPIVEETREDLESNDGKLPRNGSRRSDFTPVPSPPRRVGTGAVDLIPHSPPPSFKFLRDAEDKLLRKRLAQEAEMQRRFRCQAGHGNPPPLPLHKQNSQVIPVTGSGSSPGLA